MSGKVRQEAKLEKLSYEERIAKAGGEVLKPGTFTGKVSIVSRQDKLAMSDCEAVAALLAQETQCNIVCDEGTRLIDQARLW